MRSARFFAADHGIKYAAVSIYIINWEVLLYLGDHTFWSWFTGYPSAMKHLPQMTQQLVKKPTRQKAEVTVVKNPNQTGILQNSFLYQGY